MLKNYLEYLSSISKKFAKEQGIIDIVLYGSFIKSKEEPNDIDLILIFLSKKLNERLEIAQKFKQQIKNKIKNSDVKTANLIEIFDKNFLARQGILVEGYSLLDNIPLAEKMGFGGYSLFTYNLKNLDHNQKTKFTYSLIGRKKPGILKLVEARVLGKGAVAIPIQKSAIFDDFLKEWKINYKERKILISE